jgi:hypothetical protein
MTAAPVATGNPSANHDWLQRTASPDFNFRLQLRREVSMPNNIRSIISPARLGAVLVAALLANATAVAADISADGLKLAPAVAKAAGYETPATTYIVANSTNVYSAPSLVDTKVTGQLKRGDHVDVLAKVKGWEWVLVGKDGTGIGYVTISMLSPADKYVP